MSMLRTVQVSHAPLERRTWTISPGLNGGGDGGVAGKQWTGAVEGPAEMGIKYFTYELDILSSTHLRLAA